MAVSGASSSNAYLQQSVLTNQSQPTFDGELNKVKTMIKNGAPKDQIEQGVAKLGTIARGNDGVLDKHEIHELLGIGVEVAKAQGVKDSAGVANSVRTIKSSSASPVDNKAMDLIERGMQAKLKGDSAGVAEQGTVKEKETFKQSVGRAISGYGGNALGLTHRDATGNSSSQATTINNAIQNDIAGAENHAVTEEQAKFSKATANTCTGDSLKAAGHQVKGEVPEGAKISTNNLKEWTGKDWSSRDASKTDLSTILKPSYQAGAKPLLEVGNHVMTVQGFDSKTGTISAFDPATNKQVSITKQQMAKGGINVFVPQKLEGKDSASEVDRKAFKYSDFKGDPNATPDVKDMGKMYVLLSDPSMKPLHNSLNTMMKNNDIDGMKNLLASAKPPITNISDNQLKAISSAMTAPLSPPKTFVDPTTGAKKSASTMMEALDWVSTGNMKTRVVGGIEHTPADIIGRYTKDGAGSVSDRATSMANDLELLLKGKDGC